MKVLAVRRELLERINNIRESKDQIRVLESYWEEFSHKLASEEFPPYLRRRLEAQRDQMKTRIEYAQEKIEQWRLEIIAWKATLIHTED